MAWFILARALLVVAVASAAAVFVPLPGGPVVNAAAGAAVAGIIILAERALRSAAPTSLLGGIIGGAVGLVLGRALASAIPWPVLPGAPGGSLGAFAHTALVLAFVYLGLVFGVAYGEWLRPTKLMTLFRTTGGPQRRYKILDTSVIIDGRVADICETGFLDGTLVVPQFVLKELQMVADSSDSLKRNRGRRGLDILQKVQKMSGLDVIISDVDFPEIREVDLKLIELARSLQGGIVTNDFNLNKVASLRGVPVLNINELANALKPVVLPGEFMKVFILKEGKEYNQGVAYLDDGTMVVVDNARRLMGRTIDIVVTSVLQTTAGKMIFGRHIDPAAAAQAQGAQTAGSSLPQAAVPSGTPSGTPAAAPVTASGAPPAQAATGATSATRAAAPAPAAEASATSRTEAAPPAVRDDQPVRKPRAAS